MTAPQRPYTLDALRAATLVGVIRASERAQAEALTDGILEGGFHALEITTHTPDCFEILRTRVRANRVLGIGTVRTLEHVEAAKAAGAAFVVSPHTDPQIIERARNLDLVVLSGAFTPTEILTAHAAGADFVKIFPVSAGGGPALIRLLSGPIPDVPLWVSGDVALGEIAAYLDAGVQLIGLTSALTQSPGPHPKTTAQARAAEALEVLRVARNPAPLLTIAQNDRATQIHRDTLDALDARVALDEHVPGRQGDAVHLAPLLEQAGLTPEGDVRLISGDGFSRTVPAQDLFQGGLLCFGQNGGPLPKERGGPLRLYIVGGSDQCDNVKGLSRIEKLERHDVV